MPLETVEKTTQKVKNAHYQCEFSFLSFRSHIHFSESW